MSPSSGFVAVNARPSDTNGSSAHTASAATRTELLSKFFTTRERTFTSYPSEERRTSNPGSRPRTGTNEAPRSSKPKAGSGSTHDGIDYANATLLASTSPVPIPNTPSSLLPHAKLTPAERFDDAGPYKAEMVSRMEQLQRGDRIIPPCDRCRRLHMDCAKNLTACLGCTKKHAKCSWKDVEEEELRGYEAPAPRQHIEEELGSERSGSTGPKKKGYKREGQGVADEELLGEEESSDEDEIEEMTHQNHFSPRSQPPIQVHVAGMLTTRGSPSRETRTASPPAQNSIINAEVKSQTQTNGRLPSPPPAPVPAHAELAKVSMEIEEVEEVQASRIPDTTEVQPTIEIGHGLAGIHGVSHIENGLGVPDASGSMVEMAATMWADAPPTPPTHLAGPVVARQPFPDETSMEMKPSTSIAPLANMGGQTSV